MKKTARYLLPLLIMFMLQACGGGVLYDKQVDIENALWPKDKNVNFKVDVNDTINLYNVYLILRHNNDYKYSNVYFFLTTTFPNGKIIKDTLECILASPEGKWYGKGWGSVKEDDIFLNKVRFRYAGEYNFDFIQAMREDTLKNIESIGLRIENANR